METFSVNELAEKVSRIGNERGHDVKIQTLDNPRKEAEEHYYNPTYSGLREIGVIPHLLTDEVMHDLFEVVERYRDSIIEDVFFKGIRWD